MITEAQDRSTLEDRKLFANSVEAGDLQVDLAWRVSDCPLLLAPVTCYRLGLPEGASFADAGQEVLRRWRSGEAAAAAARRVFPPRAVLV